MSSAVVGISAFSFIRYGIPWYVAILFSISIVGTAIGFIATSGRNEIRVLPGIRGVLGGLGGLWLVFLVCLSSDRWALAEASTTVVSLVSLLAVFAVASACMILNQLVLMRPVSVSGGWKTERRENAAIASIYRKSCTFAANRGEVRIERLPTGLHDEDLWRRIQRLRAGNPPLRVTTFTIVMFAAMVGFQAAALSIFQTGQSSGLFSYSAIWINSIIVLMMATFQIGNIWRARVAILPLELMRPYSRSKLQHGMALAFVVDLLSPATIIAFVQAVAVNLNLDYSLQWRSMPVDFLLWFATDLAMAVGIGALGLAIHRLWLAATLAVVVAYNSALGTMFLAMFHIGFSSFRADKMTASLVESQLWLPILVGLVLSCLMYRRWMRMEIGRRT